MLSNFLSKAIPTKPLNASRWLGGIVAGAAFLGPQVALAGGLLPTFHSGGDRFVELRSGIERGYRSASSARYHFYLTNPKVISQRFIITEVTNNFSQSGGEFNLRAIEVRPCENLGNLLKRPKCAPGVPLSEITYCSEPGGCQTYNPETKKITVDPNPYKGQSYFSITPKDPLPQGQNLDLVFSDVQNPRLAVDYQFNLSIATPRNICAENWRTALGHCAIGTWIVPIELSNN